MTELYHLGVEESRVPPAAVLVEHGLSSDTLRESLGDGEVVGRKREFRSASGTLDGRAVLVVDVGLGAPSTVIALEELVRAGARRIVWVGRRRDPDPRSSQAIVPIGAIRSDGTSRQYAPLAYPALPDFRLSSLLREALGQQGETRLVETTDVLGDHPSVAQDLCSAAMFVVGAARGVDVATLLLPEMSGDVEVPLARTILHAVTAPEGAAP